MRTREYFLAQKRFKKSDNSLRSKRKRVTQLETEVDYLASRMSNLTDESATCISENVKHKLETSQCLQARANITSKLESDLENIHGLLSLRESHVANLTISLSQADQALIKQRNAC